MTDIENQKRDLRRIMETKRRDLFSQAPNAAQELSALFLKSVSFPAQVIVSSYFARGSEMDPALLTAALRAKGHVMALPVVTPKGSPLVFRRYDADTHVAESGTMGIPEPPPSQPEVEPDVLLVPLLAFDRRGYRLGYGGGYYDRTLNALRQKKSVLAVGIGFLGQQVNEVPTESFDARLDRIVTESEAF